METSEPNSTDNSTDDQKQGKISLWIPFLFILSLFIILTIVIICGNEIRRACYKFADNQVGEYRNRFY